MIHRLLITGTQKQLEGCLAKCNFLNVVERRGNTIFCTLLEDDGFVGTLQDVMDAAEEFDLSLQQRMDNVPEGRKTNDYWKELRRGELPPWDSESDGLRHRGG